MENALDLVQQIHLAQITNSGMTAVRFVSQESILKKIMDMHPNVIHVFVISNQTLLVLLSVRYVILDNLVIVNI